MVNKYEQANKTIKSLRIINTRLANLEKIYYGETDNNILPISSAITDLQSYFLNHKLFNITVFFYKANNVTKWDITQEDVIDFLARNTNWKQEQQSINNFLATNYTEGTLGDILFIEKTLTKTEKLNIKSWLDNIFSLN